MLEKIRDKDKNHLLTTNLQAVIALIIIFLFHISDIV